MTAKVEAAALEDRITGLLGRYASLQFDELKSLVFADGSFSYAAERELEAVLGRLVERGALQAPGKWGPFSVNREAAATVPDGRATPTATPEKHRRLSNLRNR